MKKIKVILALLIVIGVNLFSDYNYDFSFLKMNPSATDLAFGHQSGGANIWNRNPVATWSNPAKLGYHNGASFGFSSYTLDIPNTSKIEISSSYVSYGYKGIALLLPMVNLSGKFGETIDYGKQELLDFQGVDHGTFIPYERLTRYAIAINFFEYLTEFEFIESTNNQIWGDLSIGYAFNSFKADYGSDLYNINNTDAGGKEKGSYSDLGFIGRFSPINDLNSKLLSLDFTTGLNLNNFTQSETDLDSQLPYSTRTAVACKLSIKRDKKQINFGALDGLINNYFSVYLSYDNASYDDTRDGDISVWGRGVELNLCDIFSYRIGKSKEPGIPAEDFSGFGINLKYQDLVQLQYNYARFDFGFWSDKKTKFDILLNVNLMKILYN